MIVANLQFGFSIDAAQFANDGFLHRVAAMRTVPPQRIRRCERAQRKFLKSGEGLVAAFAALCVYVRLAHVHRQYRREKSIYLPVWVKALTKRIEPCGLYNHPAGIAVSTISAHQEAPAGIASSLKL